ncbi:nitroreductase/quinone reductase family protein [Geodermatophilus sp. URMC 64]
MKEQDRRVIERYRAGAAGLGSLISRDEMLLLTTVGRRTGERRTVPLRCHAEDDRLLVVASSRGAARDPDWLLNILAQPGVTVEYADETFGARAAPLFGAERDRVWVMLKDRYPVYAEYEAMTARLIPVVALVRYS